MNIQSVYDLLGARSRRKRLELLAPLLASGSETTIVDVGGTPGFWLTYGHRARVTLVNIDAPSSIGGLPGWLEYRQASGTALPFADDSFDVAFSNSVIEHLGTVEAQRSFASEIARVGRSYFVQTPSIAFPIEPHYLTPFVHWLPKSLRRRIAGRWTVWAMITHPPRDYVDKMVDEIRFVSKAEMKSYFPDGRVLTERLAWLPKSLVALKRH